MRVDIQDAIAQSLAVTAHDENLEGATMKVLLADDHDLVRDGLRPYIEQLDSDVSIEEAGSLDEVLRVAEVTPNPNLILLDLNMPGMQGLNSISQVSETFPESPIVVISGHFDNDVITGALQRGARGFVPKTARGKSLLSALKLVLEGETYVPPAMLAGDAGASAEPLPGAAPAPIEDTVLAKLSAREMSILRLLIDGKTNKEIARELDLQEITIKVHVRNAYRKIGASNRADAVRIAFQNGWQ